MINYEKNIERKDGLIISEGITMGKMRLYASLTNNKSVELHNDPLIIVASNLEPYDILELKKKPIAGFITSNGTINSHTSILIRNLEVPAITNIEIQTEWDNKFVIIDAYKGCIIIEPTLEIIKYYEVYMKIKKEDENRLLNEFRGRITKTKSGREICVYANITSISDINAVLENDAEGIGVFKTEFLYLETTDFPTEDEQFAIYKKIASTMNNQKVVIRTIDIGADKKASYFDLDEEENPAMGYRAIRICLDHPEIFLPQIKAILRASAYGNVSIMYPMITSVEEIIQIQKIVEYAKNELRNNGIPFNEDIEQGIMIETPAAVIISAELAKIVDFFSIGTNDLMQYLLAADRQNCRLTQILDPYHPAVTYSIQQVIKNAHNANIWVGISGELATDLEYIKLFVDYGVDALSVLPSQILKVRKAVCEIQ